MTDDSLWLPEKQDLHEQRRFEAATAAMQGLLANREATSHAHKQSIPFEQVITNSAVMLADLLLAKLEAGGGA